MLEKLRKFISEFFSGAPELKLNPEREKELIEKIAKLIYKTGMEFPAIMLLKPMTPVMSIISQTQLLVIAPLLEQVGIHGYEYVSLFNNKKNIQRILDKVRELSSINLKGS